MQQRRQLSIALGQPQCAGCNVLTERATVTAGEAIGFTVL
jgi:hypothetical protein